jgi:mRNA interferase YafQ
MKFKPRKTFEQDLSRLAKLDPTIVDEVHEAVNILLQDGQLPPEFDDHQLQRSWSGYNEFHLRDAPSGSKPSDTNDVLMVYRWDYDELILVGVGVGSHNILFNGKNKKTQ